mmetsp:Transcript_7965/g.20830  ORF Transcript_7965/g.20830 Transcript_7965/m.20830 type:complete len:219 (+) Transcript_7965:568-1224(+)
MADMTAGLCARSSSVISSMISNARSPSSSSRSWHHVSSDTRAEQRVSRSSKPLYEPSRITRAWAKRACSTTAAAVPSALLSTLSDLKTASSMGFDTLSWSRRMSSHSSVTASGSSLSRSHSTSPSVRWRCCFCWPGRLRFCCCPGVAAPSSSMRVSYAACSSRKGTTVGLAAAEAWLASKMAEPAANEVIFAPWLASAAAAASRASLASTSGCVCFAS